jgi:hypothetical protein
MSEPTDVVLSFIADYCRWNNAALKRQDRAEGSEKREEKADRDTAREWAALIKKYCRSGFKGESIAYGMPSMHDPAAEKVVSAKPRGDGCVVKTTSTDSDDFTQDFEYRLSRGKTRWYLESVKVVIDGKLFESL